jgi:hypothetical protein
MFMRLLVCLSVLLGSSAVFADGVPPPVWNGVWVGGGGVGDSGQGASPVEICQGIVDRWNSNGSGRVANGCFLIEYSNVAAGASSVGAKVGFYIDGSGQEVNATGVCPAGAVGGTTGLCNPSSSSSSASSASSSCPAEVAANMSGLYPSATAVCIAHCVVSGRGVCVGTSVAPVVYSCTSWKTNGASCAGDTMTPVGGDASSSASSGGSTSSGASSSAESSAGSGSSSGSASSGAASSGAASSGAASSGTSEGGSSGGSGSSAGSSAGGSGSSAASSDGTVPSGEGALNGAGSALNSAAADRNNKLGDVTGAAGKDTGWGWLPTLPNASCAALEMGPYSIDICSHAERMRTIMAWLWSLGTAYLCISMVKNTLQGGA